MPPLVDRFHAPFLPARVEVSLRRPLARAVALPTLALACALAVGCAHHAAAQLGDRPLLNVPTRTAGGTQLWADVAWREGWRIQRHAWTGHARLLDSTDVRRAWGSVAACSAELERLVASGPNDRRDPTVVLIHGLWGTRGRMDSLGAAFEARGYDVVDVAYPSTTATVEDHAGTVAAVLESLDGTRDVSFVTFSLGGLVLRELLSDDRAAWRRRHRLGRAVLMAAPNRGARFAEVGARVPGALTLYGEPARQVANGLARELPGLDLPFLTIAARRRGGGGGFNPWIPGPDDGVVGVDETRLEGASAHLVVESLHAFVPRNETAVAAAVEFIDAGELPPDAERPSRRETAGEKGTE